MRDYSNHIPSAASSHLDILDLPNCVYLLENGRCRELTFKKCKGTACRFCLTKDRFADSRRKWSDRLNSLDEKKQSEISKKYYGGKTPWKQD